MNRKAYVTFTTIQCIEVDLAEVKSEYGSASKDNIRQAAWQMMGRGVVVETDISIDAAVPLPLPPKFSRLSPCR
jgi:hypothetical protein